MPVCYVVIAYHPVVHNPHDLQVLCVFLDQLKARRFVENYPTEPNQCIITCTSWLDDEQLKSSFEYEIRQLDRFS